MHRNIGANEKGSENECKKTRFLLQEEVAAWFSKSESDASRTMNDFKEKLQAKLEADSENDKDFDFLLGLIRR